jgi:RNA polymerase sigma factor (sigma-70 family)
MAAPTLETDQELAARCASGDREAFTELYDRFSQGLYDFALRTVRNRDAAADVVQLAFVRAWEHLERGTRPQNVKAWLYTIARNGAIDEIRRGKRTVTESAEPDAPSPIARELDRSQLSRPEDFVRDQELVDLVWQAAAALNPREYSLLDLHLRKELSADELAETLGLRRDNVYMMLSRLRSSLADAVTCMLVMRHGRGQCAELDRLLTESSTALTPINRRAIKKHLQACDACHKRSKRFAAPLEIFAGIAPLALPIEVKGAMWEQVVAEIDGAGPPPGGQTPGVQHRLSASHPTLVPVGAALGALLGLALLVIAVRPIGPSLTAATVGGDAAAVSPGVAAAEATEPPPAGNRPGGVPAYPAIAAARTLAVVPAGPAPAAEISNMPEGTGDDAPIETFGPITILGTEARSNRDSAPVASEAAPAPALDRWAPVDEDITSQSILSIPPSRLERGPAAAAEPSLPASPAGAVESPVLATLPQPPASRAAAPPVVAPPAPEPQGPVTGVTPSPGRTVPSARGAPAAAAPPPADPPASAPSPPDAGPAVPEPNRAEGPTAGAASAGRAPGQPAIPVPSSPTPRPSATATALPSLTPTSPPTLTPTVPATATPTPIARRCPDLTNPELQASTSPSSNLVVITWSGAAGCPPFAGAITARYQRERAPYASYPISARTGTLTDSPPRRCDGLFAVVYTLTLQEGDGSDVSDTATTAVRWPTC